MMGKGLPEGWVTKESKSRPNVFFYFNSVTGETQWEKPTAPAKRATAKQVKCSHLLVKHRDSRRPASWKEVRTPSCDKWSLNRHRIPSHDPRKKPLPN